MEDFSTMSRICHSTGDVSGSLHRRIQRRVSVMEGAINQVDLRRRVDDLVIRRFRTVQKLCKESLPKFFPMHP